MRHARKIASLIVLCALLALALAPLASGDGPGDLPQGVAMPPDIRAIIEKAQHGDSLTVDEVEKLRAWSHEAATKTSGVPPRGAAQQIPARISMTLTCSTVRRSTIRQTVVLHKHSAATLTVDAGGTGDYRKRAYGGREGTLFAFKPAIEHGAQTTDCGGDFRIVDTEEGQAGAQSTSTKVGRILHPYVGAAFWTTGAGDLLWPGCSRDDARGWTEDVDGIETVGGGRDASATRPISSASFGTRPFENESQTAPASLADPYPTPMAHLSCAALTDAIERGVTRTFTVSEQFSYVVNPNDPDGNAVHVSGMCTFTITIRPSPTALLIEAQDQASYANWLPAPLDEPLFAQAGLGHTAPSAVTVRARLVKERGSQEPAESGARIDFYLDGVSKLDGWCTNYPAKAGPKTAFHDLQFRRVQPPGTVYDSWDHVHSAEGVVSAMALVEAFDTGARGWVKARVEATGTEALEPRTGSGGLCLPLDDNQNEIADCWEKAVGLDDPNLQATVDDDRKPEHQRDNGDGFTLFEEYRGFVEIIPQGPGATYATEKRRFVRTDPDMKDVFIFDDGGLFEKHYLGRNPAKVTWHFVDRALMQFSGVATDEDNRWVNSNTPTRLRKTRQYGMYCVDDATHLPRGSSGDPTIGGVQQRSDIPYNDQFFEPLRWTYECRIYTSQPRASYSQLLPLAAAPNWKGAEGQALLAYYEDYEVAQTVLHEIGHYLGISHHLQPGVSLPLLDYQAAQQMQNGAWVAEDSSGGYYDCAMRYQTDQETHDIRFNGYRMPLFIRYCTPNDHGTDANNDPIDSNNCFGSIRVSCLFR